MPVNFRPPAWRHEVVANLTGGGKVATMPDQRSTAEALSIDVCSNCHPAYTGRQQSTATGSRVERFNRRRALAIVA